MLLSNRVDFGEFYFLLLFLLLPGNFNFALSGGKNGLSTVVTLCSGLHELQANEKQGMAQVGCIIDYILIIYIIQYLL